MRERVKGGRKRRGVETEREKKSTIKLGSKFLFRILSEVFAHFQRMLIESTPRIFVFVFTRKDFLLFRGGLNNQRIISFVVAFFDIILSSNPKLSVLKNIGEQGMYIILFS